jgi:hypothetical protein
VAHYIQVLFPQGRFSGGINMKWNEMSVIQRVLTVVGWISIPTWFVLTILDESGVVETTNICRLLMALWAIGTGCMQKWRWVRVLYYIMAGLWLALVVRGLL